MSLTVDASRVSRVVPVAPTGTAVHTSAPTPLPVFNSDDAVGPDCLNRDTQAAFLAELICHQTAGTPFCLGLFGPVGSGKSAFLESLTGAVQRLVAAADEAGLATPFVSRVAMARVLAEPGASPAAVLLRQAAAALAAQYPKLADEAHHAGRDPRLAARDAGERLNETRQRLDAERRTLDDLAGRQVRLADSVLFETAGSRVDAYARSHRSRIERGMRRFGFAGDPLTTFKELVRDASEAGGRLAYGLRAFWAFRGQTRLIVTAIVLFAAAWGTRAVIENQVTLIENLRSTGDKAGGLADWAQNHAGWLAPLAQGLVIAGLLALALNVVRGLRFVQPILKGATLLRQDIEARRRDLDSLLGHQTQRVDNLKAETEAAGQHAAEAESRLAVGGVTPVLPRATIQDDADPEAAAHNFFAAVGTAMAEGSRDKLPSSTSGSPVRLVVAIDGLDRLSSVGAAEFVATARMILDQPGIVTIVAADHAHLVSGLAEADPALATDRLNRLVQVPVAIGAGTDAWQGRLVQALLRPAGLAGGEHLAAAPDATHSALDMPWLQSEHAVLEALGPAAGTSPRAVKRFVNLYRVARADPQMRGGTVADLAALALALALRTAGLPTASLDGSSQSSAFNDEIQKASRVVNTALGSPLDLRDATRGLQTAQHYDPTTV